MAKNKRSKSVVSFFEIIVVATMSSGKSTLINSMLGKELLHCANEATTATITRIHNKDQQNNFNGSAYNFEPIKSNEKARLKFLDYKSVIDSETLKKWNADNNINYISLTGNIPSIKNSSKHIVLYDSPGPNNSQDNTHQDLTLNLVSDGRYGMIIYVLNATQIGINDDKLFLSQISQVLKNDKHKNIIFILNKADVLDEEKGEDIEIFVRNIASYLKNIGFINPTIIPVSALSALNARKALNKEPLTRFERNLLQQNIHNLDDNRLIRASYNISDEVKIMSLPNTEKKDMSITIKDGLEISKNKIDQLIYFSGIPLLENIINHKFQETIL